MYKLIRNIYGGASNVVTRTTDGACIPFDPANTDYANFKKEILADEAQLQDAEGATMTTAEAKSYIATLP